MKTTTIFVLISIMMLLVGCAKTSTAPTTPPASEPQAAGASPAAAPSASPAAAPAVSPGAEPAQAPAVQTPPATTEVKEETKTPTETAPAVPTTVETSKTETSEPAAGFDVSTICEAKDDEQACDEKLLSKALDSGDTTICDSITDDYTAQGCIYEIGGSVGTEAKDEAACDKLENAYAKEICINFAMLSKGTLPACGKGNVIDYSFKPSAEKNFNGFGQFPLSVGAVYSLPSANITVTKMHYEIFGDKDAPGVFFFADISVASGKETVTGSLPLVPCDSGNADYGTACEKMLTELSAIKSLEKVGAGIFPDEGLAKSIRCYLTPNGSEDKIPGHYPSAFSVVFEEA